MERIYLDFDNTMINSVKIITELLNIRYNKNVRWKDVREYNLTDQFPEVSRKEIIELFENKEFFYKVKDNIYPDCEKVLNKLCKDFDVYVVSIGTAENIARKSLVIKEVFPQIKNCIFLTKTDGVMDKSIIRMGKEDFIIDDHIDNIKSSSAGNRLLFSFEGIETNWNKNSDGLEIIKSWKDIERRIYGNI